MVAQAKCGRRGGHPRSLVSDKSARLTLVQPVEFSPQHFLTSQKARASLCLSQIPRRAASPSREYRPHADALLFETATRAKSYLPRSLARKARALRDNPRPHSPPPCKRDALDT